MITIASSRTLRRSRSEPSEKVARLEITRKATSAAQGAASRIVAEPGPLPVARQPEQDRKQHQPGPGRRRHAGQEAGRFVRLVLDVDPGVEAGQAQRHADRIGQSEQPAEARASACSDHR